MTARTVRHGAAHSVPLRAVPLAVQENSVSRDHVAVDVVAADVHRQSISPGMRSAVPPCSNKQASVDEARPSPWLQPTTPPVRARESQPMTALDSYAFRTPRRDNFVERGCAPSRGDAPGEARIATALPHVQSSVRALADINGGGRWPAGNALSLADINTAPTFAFVRSPEGETMIAECAPIPLWWDRRATRSGIIAARLPRE
jgi:hypothetical protein